MRSKYTITFLHLFLILYNILLCCLFKKLCYAGVFLICGSDVVPAVVPSSQASSAHAVADANVEEETGSSSEAAVAVYVASNSWSSAAASAASRGNSVSAHAHRVAEAILEDAPVTKVADAVTASSSSVGYAASTAPTFRCVVSAPGTSAAASRAARSLSSLPTNVAPAHRLLRSSTTPHLPPQASRLIEAIKRDDPSIDIMKLKQLISRITSVIVDSLIDALYNNTMCQALFWQNMAESFRSHQLKSLTAMLKVNKTIWYVNLGENTDIDLADWWLFCDSIPETSITHVYICTSITCKNGELKRSLIDNCLNNRSKHCMYADPNNKHVWNNCGGAFQELSLK